MPENRQQLKSEEEKESKNFDDSKVRVTISFSKLD